MTSLDDYKRACHARGFNVSKCINRYKKELRNHKAQYDVPDEVLIGVCQAFLDAHEVRSPYPYFRKVLRLKLGQHQASLQITEASSYKGSRPLIKAQPQRLCDILANS